MLRRVLVLFLLLALLLSGCSEAAQSGTRQIDLAILGGSPTGVWYMVTSGVGECVKKNHADALIQITPGGGATNPIRIGRGEADVGMTHNILAKAALEGREPFEDPIPSIRAVAGFYDSSFQMVLDRSLGIERFDEIIENRLKVRLSVEKPGSSGQVAFERMLEAYGVTVEEMEAWGCEILNKNFEQSSAMLSDGLIDGFSLCTLAPAPPIVQSAIGKDLVLLELNPEILKKMANTYGYAPQTIAAGTYDFQTHDWETVSATSMLIADAAVPEEDVYELVRSIAEHLDYMHDVHVALEPLTPASMAKNLGIEMHPGARRYYEEQGLLPDRD